MGAAACVHALIIMTWGMGLNSGACADLVHINQVPWGWVAVHHAFTRQHLARMCGWLGTHSSVRGLASGSLCRHPVRAGRGGSEEDRPSRPLLRALRGQSPHPVPSSLWLLSPLLPGTMLRPGLVRQPRLAWGHTFY